MSLFWYRCDVSTFRVPLVPFELIAGINGKGKANLRRSVYRLYRWLLYVVDDNHSPTIPARLSKYDHIEKATGLSTGAIIAAWKELARLDLIRAEPQGGPGAGYRFTVTAPSEQPSYLWMPLRWDEITQLGRLLKGKYRRYIVVPYASMDKVAWEKWDGTDALVYDAICETMFRVKKNEFPKTELGWFKEIAKLSKNTLKSSIERLIETGSIRVQDGTIEVLHPETSESMPEKAWEQKTSDRNYYIDESTGARRLFSEEQLTPADFERYFLKSLGDKADQWNPGQNAHCPFPGHDDQNPSLSINVETGQFYCHACDIGGDKLVSFEMQLLETNDVHEAWPNVAKKLGLKVGNWNRGPETHRHVYHDANGLPCYETRRYKDGSLQPYLYREDGRPRPCKKGEFRDRRILYNLHRIAPADVVVIVEGEKKADALTNLVLWDSNGKPVAITTTGGAGTWHFKFHEPLKGKRVLVLPDADEPGKRYASAISSSLIRAGIEHWIVDFDRFGNDVRDFLEAHNNNRDELIEHINDEINTPLLGVAPVVETAHIEMGEITI